MKLKFLIDECTGKRLSNLLKTAGYDSIFVGDWKPSAIDEEVLQKAYDDERILIRMHLLETLLKSTDVNKKFVSPNCYSL